MAATDKSPLNPTPKKRTYHYIFDEEVQQSQKDGAGMVKHAYSFKYKTIDVESEDLLDEEVILLAFPIKYLNHIDSILRTFGLKDDVFNFYQQCMDVIAAPENHIDEKGKGKLSFQSFFNNVPFSLTSIGDSAIVLVGLHPEPPRTDNKLREYHLVGYIHINRLTFMPDKSTGEIHNGYYYNLLRMSERSNNGVKVYRRKKLFTLFFTVMLDLTFVGKVNYAYATMGKENQKIKDALHACAVRYGIHYERQPFTVYSKINSIFGSKNYANQLIDITENQDRLKEYYKKVHTGFSDFLFYNMLTEAEFLAQIKKITSYSKSSRVYMLPDENGGMKACSFAIHWGDYFKFLILNPKGIFRLIAALKITEKVVFPVWGTGNPADYKNLLKGIGYIFKKNEGTQMTFLNSYEGDPYRSVKKSIIADDYIYFIITHNKEKLQAYKKLASDEAGNMRLYMDRQLL